MKKLLMILILLVCFMPISFASNEKIYIYGGDGLIASKEGEDVTYYSQDFLGSNKIVSDEDGEIISKNVQYPFGEDFSEEGNKEGLENNYKFTGQEEDEDLYYYGARYYDPSIARFISLDPMYSSGVSPYAYVNNNPLKYVDPSGNWREEPSEGNLRTWNIGISAAFPLFAGIYRGDSAKDILKNTFYGSLTGLGSFEIKRNVGKGASSNSDFLFAGLAENFLSSIRFNVIQNKNPLTEIQLDYLMFTLSFSKEGFEPGLNLARTFDLISFAGEEGNKFDLSSSLETGVPIFTRKSFGKSSSTKSGFYAGESGFYGGAISYLDYKEFMGSRKNIMATFRHEFIHNLQSKNQFSIGSSIGPNYNPSIFGIKLYGLENIKGNLLGGNMPYLIHGISTGSFGGLEYYTSNWDWMEREANCLER